MRKKLILLAIALAACGSGHELVGAWEQGGGYVTMVFHGNGTGERRVYLNDGRLIVAGRFTWSSERGGDLVMETTESYSLDFGWSSVDRRRPEFLNYRIVGDFLELTNRDSRVATWVRAD